MRTRARIAVLFLVLVLLAIAAVVCTSLPSPDVSSEPPGQGPVGDLLADWDHSKEGYTCSICHAPPRSHAGMTFNRCEDCHAYPSWAAPHPEGDNCLQCHTLPGNHIATSGGCLSCHPDVGESWRFVHTDGMVCVSCHAEPAGHYGSDCARCHDPSVPWAQAKYPHTAGMNCASCHPVPHRTYSGVSCVSCHPAVGVSWRFRHFTATSCSPCHEALRPPGHPAGDCVSCHYTSGWTPARHPDAASACLQCHPMPHVTYPLSCASCHPIVGVTWRFTHPQVTGCATCHEGIRPPGHPAGDCGACHSTTAWTPAIHPPQTSTCETCHTVVPAPTPVTTHPSAGCASCHAIPPATWADGVHPPTTATCANCHTPPPAHFGADCGACHSTSAWTPAIHPPQTSTCETCHTVVPAPTQVTTHPSAGCASCHAIPPATWADGVHPPTTATCANCHTRPPEHSGGPCSNCHAYANGDWSFAHPDRTDCATCHDTTATHQANAQSDWVKIFDPYQHDDAMVPKGAPYEVWAECVKCHSLSLTAIHADCMICHSTFTAPPTWDGGCEQSGCHYPAYHEDSPEAHDPWAGSDSNCNLCHAPAWTPTDNSCVNCHALYNPANTTLPVTTSDAIASYIGGARIRFSIWEGTKVSVGTTFYKLNGGATTTGGSVTILTPGAYTLEFWSVDQAGNTEASTNTVSFTIAPDTTPPVTTSNAVATYYNTAVIQLTATDAHSLGVKTTYYILDGGPVQTIVSGSSVTVPAVVGIVPHTLTFWSEDWSGNVEAQQTVNFTIIYGTGTLRLSWPNPPAGAAADWFIYGNAARTQLVTSGSNSGPTWTGIDDVTLQVRAEPYYITVVWYDPDQGYDDETQGSATISYPGEIVVFSY